MPVHVRIPPTLRRYADGAGEVAVEGRTVGDALAALFARHPRLEPRVMNDRGSPHPYLLFFLNESELPRGDLAAALADGDRLDIVGAVEGG